jgi:hypothetical protein
VNKGSSVPCSGNAATCDGSTCCEATAKCDSYLSCTGGTPVNKGSSVECSGNAATCDVSTCCGEAKATCNSYSSCTGGTPVNKGSGVECTGNAATCDVSTCCEAKAKCDSYSSCAGTTPVNKGSGVECSGNAATCDVTTCCKALEYALVKSDAECGSGDTSMGTKDSVLACAIAVKKSGGLFFVFGKGAKKGKCYKENTVSAGCKEGWQKTSKYDFYSLQETANKDGAFTEMSMTSGVPHDKNIAHEQSKAMLAGVSTHHFEAKAAPVAKVEGGEPHHLQQKAEHNDSKTPATKASLFQNTGLPRNSLRDSHGASSTASQTSEPAVQARTWWGWLRAKAFGSSPSFMQGASSSKPALRTSMA